MSTAPPVAADHNGLHAIGVPEQPAAPAASKAYNEWSADPTNTVGPVTAGEELIAPPVVAVHSGAQTLGVPEHPDTPASLTA